jgi:hypothetical protein
MKKIYVLLLTLCFTALGFSQTTLYSEDFTGQNGKGATGTIFGPTTDLSGVDWTIDISATDLGGTFFGFGNTDFFRVENEAFTGEDTDGNAFWLSPSIPISGFSDVSLSLDASTSGNLENDDTFLTEYRINGGAWTTAATNGNLTNDFNLVVSQTGLSGNNLEIRIRVNNNEDNENTTFDNVLVVGTILCPEISGLTIDSFTSTLANISWTAGGTEAGWEIAVQPQGTGVPAGSGTPVATTSYVDNTLTQNTAYEVYVRADCSNTSDGFSLWTGPINFTTPIQTPVGVTCAPGGTTSYIFTEEFDAQGSWTGDFNGGSGTWIIPRSGTTPSSTTGPNGAQSGSNYMHYEASFSGDVGSSETASAVSPAINLTAADAAELSFFLHAYGAAMGTLNVGVSTSASGPFTTLFTQTGQLQTSGAAPWVAVGINLDAYVGQTIYIEFENTGAGGAPNTFTGDMSIDFLRVETCVLPTPVTYTYDNGWDTDPNGVATAVDTINIIAGEATISSNTAADIITVNPLGSLLVNSGVTLDISGSLDMQSQSDQYSSLILDGTILGTVNYNRHINDFQSTSGATTGQNDLISPPLTSATQNFLDFRTINTNIPSGTIGGGTTTFYLFGPFDNTNNAYVNWSAANNGDLLVPGVGYRTASLTATPNDTFVFTGDVQSGPVTVGISVGSGSRWNLIGNPYPSYLSADAFLALTSNNTLLDDDAVAIYGYDGSATDGWDVINFNTSSSYNMAPGQGFLVAAKSGGSITFNEAMRRNSGSDDFIPNRNAFNPYLKLQMTSATNSYHTDFYFNNSSSRGLDRGYDAVLFDSYLPDFYIYSHLVDDNQGRAMSIQSLGVSDLSDVVIPLGLKVSQGLQVTIGIQDTSLPANVQVYLEDNLTNTFTLLNTGDYTFTANANIDGTGRFFLRYSEDTLSNPEQDLSTLQIFTTKAKELVVNGQLYGATTLNLYDIQGRAVFTAALDDRQTSQRMDVSHLSSGVYVAKLNTGSQQKTQKVIIR